MPKIYYVALVNDTMYWTSFGSMSSDVRDARMYKTVKTAIDNVSYAIKKYNRSKSNPADHITSYQIVEIEVKTRGIIEKIEI